MRPLHSILCTFDGEIVPFEIGGIKSGNKTRGHRFLGNDIIEVRRFDDYVEKLKRAHVILNPAERKSAILHDAKQLAHAQNLELIEDDSARRRSRGPRRMARRADRPVRQSLPRRAAGNPDLDHAREPKILRAARSQDRQAREQIRRRSRT